MRPVCLHTIFLHFYYLTPQSIKDKLVDLIERIIQRKGSPYIACNDRHAFVTSDAGGSRVVRWCWVTFQCRGVLQFWLQWGKGLLRLRVRVRTVWTFSLSSILSPLSPSLWETARYRLKYCLKGPLNPEQPTKQPLLQYKISIYGLVRKCAKL